MTLRALDSGTDREAWLTNWKRWGEREPSAHPSYATSFARDEDRTVCLTYQSPHGSVLFPVIERPLAAEPWTPDDVSARDLVTPYGYGGPFCFDVSDRDALQGGFWEAFEAWAGQRRIASLFGRLSLFADQLLRWPRGVVEVQSNVVRRLDCTPDELWRDYAHKVRKNVKRARRAGLVVEQSEGTRYLDDLCTIYDATMRRNAAADGYFFPRSFFETLVRELLGNHMVFVVRDTNGRAVSAELVLASSSHLYSFLGGTMQDGFADRPNDLLKHAVCEWGMATGRTAFVLGGGYGADDGIFRYKRSFAPTGTVPFRVGRLVLDEDGCAGLVELRRQHDEGWRPREGFFPAYRS
ncbi:MAG: GNAT family N-acetyltransferase [Polyangiaceae bacterium]